MLIEVEQDQYTSLTYLGAMTGALVGGADELWGARDRGSVSVIGVSRRS